MNKITLKQLKEFSKLIPFMEELKSKYGESSARFDDYIFLNLEEETISVEFAKPKFN